MDVSRRKSTEILFPLLHVSDMLIKLHAFLRDYVVDVDGELGARDS